MTRDETLEYLPRQALEEFCRRHRIAELSVFGSAEREDFGPESDIDLLVTFHPDANVSLLDHAAIVDELESLLGRPVDLITKRAIERSKNWIRKDAILRTARKLYESGRRNGVGYLLRGTTSN